MALAACDNEIRAMVDEVFHNYPQAKMQPMGRPERRDVDLEPVKKESTAKMQPMGRPERRDVDLEPVKK